MKKRLQVPLFTLVLTLFCFAFTADGWGQGLETFDNSSLTTSYANGSFVGNSGITWAYVHSRDANNDANGSGINLPALMLRRIAEGSKITSSAIPGGIGNFSVKLYKGFTGGGNRQVEISVNGVSQGTSIPFDNFNEQIFTVNNINISGNVIIEIRNITTRQIIIDDISWTAFSGGTPLLSASPTTITGLDYIVGSGPSTSQTFELSGANLDGTDVDVVLPALSDFEISEDDTNFSDSLNFTAFDGTATTIYVRLKAGLAISSYTDDITISGGGANDVLISLEGNVVQGPPALTALNVPYEQDFSSFVSAETLPNGWFLDDIYSYQGAFGSEVSGGLRGEGVLGMQLTASGTNSALIATLSLINNTGNTIESLYVSYLGKVERVDQTGTPKWEVSVNGSLVNALEYSTATGVDQSKIYILTGLNILDGATIDVEWFTTATGTSGIRRQIGVTDVKVMATNAFVYEDTVWTPSNPATNATADDSIVVVNGEATFSDDIELNTIVINVAAALSIGKILKVNGDISNNGTLTFKSTSVTNTAQLDTFTGTITGSGEVTVERFIPERRAFRLLSSSVNTSGNIRANWQEGQNNTGTNFPDDNSNTNSGFGTHITGSTTGLNGFDATPSGNPSLFTLNNTTQAWVAVTNTDVNTITAGTAYRLFVRGDRSINVTDNAATPTNTTLRTTGALHTGPLTVSNLSPVVNESNFFGNPYPAAVDMNDVIAVSTNVNQAFYYIWDPTLSGDNGRGAYVTIDLPAGTNSSGSSANQYLQPGQAAFVTTLANGAASLQFQETQKNVVAALTTVFSISSKMDIRLYRAAAFANGETPSDGLRLKFAEDQTNAITSQDAPKFYNQDENLASSNDDRLWSIESRALPLAGESIPLFTNQYRTIDYVFEAILTEVNDITALLRDHYTGTDTVLVNNENTLYAFEVDATIPSSIANDRFEIVFEEETLSSDTPLFGDEFILYPNPTSSTFYIATRGIQGDEVRLTVRSITGQKVFTKTMTVPSNGQLQVELPALSSGMYLVELTHPIGGIFTSKLIKK